MKNNNIEKRIYELLGIKLFKKIVLARRYKNNNKLFRIKSSNYNMGNVKTLDDIKNHKKWLLLNALIHLGGIIYCSYYLGKGIYDVNLFTIGFQSAFIVLNSYCIMLQRYNEIRIDQVANRFKHKYELQKENMKKELILNDKALDNHTYAIVKYKKEKPVSFEELISNATLNQLYEFRTILNNTKYLAPYLKEITTNNQEVTIKECVNNKVFKIKFPK